MICLFPTKIGSCAKLNIWSIWRAGSSIWKAGGGIWRVGGGI